MKVNELEPLHCFACGKPPEDPVHKPVLLAPCGCRLDDHWFDCDYLIVEENEAGRFHGQPFTLGES